MIAKIKDFGVVVNELLNLDSEAHVTRSEDDEGHYVLVWSKSDKFKPEFLTKDALVICMENGWEYVYDEDEEEHDYKLYI